MHLLLIVLMPGFISTRFVSALGEKFSSPTDLTSTSTASAGSSLIVHHIVVGAAGNLIFRPDNVKASIDDIIEFNFLSLNHTLTQSTLQQPCVSNGVFDTGFNQFNPKNISGKHLIRYQVETVDPQWFFCAQTIKKSHCEAGMVFSVNAASKSGSISSSTTSANDITSVTVELPTTAEATGISPAFCSFPASTTSALDSSSTWIDTLSTASTINTISTSSSAASANSTALVSSTHIQNITTPQVTPTISHGEVLEFSMMMAIFSVLVVEVTKFFLL